MRRKGGRPRSAPPGREDFSLATGRVETSSARQAELRNDLVRAVQRQVVSGLQVEPELRSGIESLGQQPSRFRGDTPLTAHNLVDALHGNLDMRGERHLADTEFIEKFFFEDGAGMRSVGIKCGLLGRSIGLESMPTNQISIANEIS